MRKQSNEDMMALLYATLTKVNNIEDMSALLIDMCTNNELIQMAQRLYSAQLLIEGNTYSQIMSATDISSATLSRVSNALQYGKGGYRLSLDN